MVDAEEVRKEFPQVEGITNEELKEKTIEVWVKAANENGYEDLDIIPWWPPLMDEVNGEKQVDHVRDVTSCSIKIVEALEGRRGAENINLSTVIAGSILHDISKLYETTESGLSELQDFIPHPHYSVSILAQADLPLQIQHIALAHSPNCNVEPRTIEAKIVELADQIVVQALYWRNTGNLR